MRLVILFDILLNPSAKMTTSFASIARTSANTVNLYIRKDFKSLGLVLNMKKKKLILNELKTA